MRTILQNVCMAVLIVIFTIPVLAENTYSDRKEVQFPNPSKPGMLKVISGEGNITVEGYSGKEVIIETKSTVENVLNPPESEKAKGMKRISGSGLSVTVEKEHNAVVITRSMKNKTDLLIKVPYTTSLQFGGGDTVGLNQDMDISNGRNINVGAIVNTVLASLNIPGGLMGGNITVSNVSGEIEVSILDGNIKLNNVSGGVIANSLDGELLVTFKEVDGDKPMAFSTIEGDIDVTFPSDIQATVTAKNVDGEVYTDFEIDMTMGHEVIKDHKNTGFTDSLVGMFGNTVTGKINGGGAEILMTTVDGDIYVRKGK